MSSANTYMYEVKEKGDWEDFLVRMIMLELGGPLDD